MRADWRGSALVPWHALHTRAALQILANIDRPGKCRLSATPPRSASNMLLLDSHVHMTSCAAKDSVAGKRVAIKKIKDAVEDESDGKRLPACSSYISLSFSAIQSRCKVVFARGCTLLHFFFHNVISYDFFRLLRMIALCSMRAWKNVLYASDCMGKPCFGVVDTQAWGLLEFAIGLMAIGLMGLTWRPVLPPALSPNICDAVSTSHACALLIHPARCTPRLLRELKLLRHCRGHENFIIIKDIILSPGGSDFKDIYIVTDLMDTDLYRIVRSPQQLSDDHVRYFIYQVLRGLKSIQTLNPKP